MSFYKAEQLMQLAITVAASYRGVTVNDVADRFVCSHRTAQRMLRSLERQFPDTVAANDDEGRRRWRLPSGALRELLTLTPEELTALDLAITTLRRSSLQVEADDLVRLREKIMALVPRSKVARLATDHEVLLEAQGLAARPGPRQRIDRKIAAVVAEAIKAPCVLELVYQSRADGEPRRRRVAPYGLLTGLRRYLVGKPAEDAAGLPRLYVFENIQSAVATSEAFEKDTSFNLQDFAQRAFGVFQNEEEFGDVAWRFAPTAAERARSFEFHPTQVLTDEPDGSLTVRFRAAGHLEMAWHIYMWGDQVEVLAPPRLREMVAAFRRSDFPSLP